MKKIILSAMLVAVGSAAMAQGCPPPDKPACPPPQCERIDARVCDKCGQEMPKFKKKDCFKSKDGIRKPSWMNREMTDEQKKEFEANRAEMKSLVDACRADRSEANIAKLKAAIKTNMEKMQSTRATRVAKVEKKLADIEKDLNEENDADDIAKLKAEKAKLQGFLERMKNPPKSEDLDQMVANIASKMIEGKRFEIDKHDKKAPAPVASEETK